MREDFLAGTNGAMQVSAEVLDSLQVLQKLTAATRTKGQSISELQVWLPFQLLFHITLCENGLIWYLYIYAKAAKLTLHLSHSGSIITVLILDPVTFIYILKNPCLCTSNKTRWMEFTRLTFFLMSDMAVVC